MLPPTFYTAEEAVEDGLLLHFSPATALEAGYTLPVLLTRAAYAAAVQWTRGENWQSEDARFWDVLTVIRAAARAALNDGSPRETYVLRVPDTTPPASRARRPPPPVSRCRSASRGSTSPDRRA